MPEVRCRLSYNRQLDRLIGGDFFRDFQGRPVKSTLMSQARAYSLNEATGELVGAYRKAAGLGEGGDIPLPQVLAIIALEAFPVEVDGQQQMAAVEDLFTLRQLADAPEEYRELGQLLAVVPEVGTLAGSAPRAAGECAAMAARLFRIVGCGHRLPATFTRAGGCSLRPDSVTPGGGINDLYYLTLPGPGAPSGDLRAAQRNDLLQAFSTVLSACRAASPSPEEVLEKAVEGYAGRAPAPAALAARAREAASGLGGPPYSSPSAAAAIGALADSLLDALGARGS